MRGLTSRRPARSGALRDGSPRDSAFGFEQLGGLQVHVDALAAAAIAARAAHGVVDRRESPGIREINVGALA